MNRARSDTVFCPCIRLSTKTLEGTKQQDRWEETEQDKRKQKINEKSRNQMRKEGKGKIIEKGRWNRKKKRREEKKIYRKQEITKQKLIPWSTVVPEKLTGPQLIKKPIFYGTWSSITSFTSARHLSLSWARSIQYMSPHPTSWRFILVLSSYLRLGLRRKYNPLLVQCLPCLT